MVQLTAPRRVFLALVSGGLLSLGFLSPADLAAGSSWLGVVLLIAAALGARPRLGALLGFLNGAVFYTLTVPWIYEVMRVHGGLPAGAAAGVMALVVIAASLFTAAFSLSVAWISRRSVARACIAAPFLWVALEFGRTHVPHIGFPWNLLGYAVAGSLPLLQITAIAGIYGLSFLIAAYGSFAAWALVQRDGRYGYRDAASTALAGLSLFVVSLTSLASGWVPRALPQHTARLVQTNFPQSPSYPADWMERHAAELEELERLSIPTSEKPPGLVVWPEVPAPFFLQEGRFAARAERIARGSGGNFLVGVVDWKPGAQGGLAPYNSAALLDASGREVFLYDKIHLVPFGEYVPLRRWLTFAGQLTAGVGEFQHGTEYTVGTLAGGGRFGVYICYEAVFPDEVRRFTAHGAQLLVNLSNDGWFGHSAAPKQHLAMARVRAAENRRWLLRVTNTGYTVVVDPYGRYAARMPPDLRGALMTEYGLRTDRTPYVRWGDWLAWLCVAVTLGILALGFAGRGFPVKG